MTELEKRVTVGDVLQARLVFIDHGTKSARLSLRPHILDYRGPKDLPALGTSVTHSIVLCVVGKTSYNTTNPLFFQERHFMSIKCLQCRRNTDLC